MNTTALEHTFGPPKIATAAVNGIELYTRTVGAGADVVVLHGGPGAGHGSLLPAFDGLAGDRRLRYYDQRGCGGSPVGPGVALDWHSHVDDLRETLDFWDIECATLIGHSWGALLALLFSIQNPGRVEHLLLVTPASATVEGRKVYLQRLSKRMTDLGIVRRQRELLRSGLRKSDPDRFRRQAFELSLAPYLKNPEDVPEIEPFHISHRVREAVWRSLGDYDLTEQLSRFSVHALVLHGGHDPIPLSSSQHIARLLDARLEVFENSGHMPFFEETERFHEAAKDFLSKE